MTQEKQPVYGLAELAPVVNHCNYMPIRWQGSWGPRQIPDIELILCLEGRFELVLEQETIAHHPPDVLVIFPGETHTYRIQEHCREGFFFYIHVEPVAGRCVAREYRLSPAPQRLTDSRRDPEIRSLFRKISEVYHQPSPHQTELVSALMRELWIRLARLWDTGSDTAMDRRLSEMLQFLRDHLPHPIGRNDVAREFGFTPQHVNYLFRKHLHTTPTKFIHQQRVKEAYRLMLEEGASVAEAARRVGFCDAFHFSKVFKKIVGLPPSKI
jgi:AraC-like DNA-binding protein